MPRVMGISRGEARGVWAECAAILGDEVTKAGETPETMLALIEKGMAQLWTLQDDGKIIAVGITQITDVQGIGTCHAIALAGGGVVANAAKIMALVEGWARENRCTAIRFEGRAGWQRIFEPQGFVMKSIILEKAL